MKKIVMVLLSFTLLLFFGLTVFAAENEPAEIDVYARYVSAGDGEYTAEIISAAANITMEDGTVISVSGAPERAVTLVVVPIPTSEKEAWEWFAECLKNTGTPVLAYDIYFLDSDGNCFNADGAVITMTAPSVDGTLIACSVNTDGIGEGLASAVNAGKITFTTNGSHYYVLAEKAGAAQTDDPEEPLTPENPSTSEISNPTDTPKTGDNSNLLPWIILLTISGAGILFLLLPGKENE